MIPGVNVLNMAMSIIAPQVVQYCRFVGRGENEAGFEVSVYADPVEVHGSMQPVPRTRYEAMGLDYAKTYWTLRAGLDVLGVTRDSSGDQIIYAGKRLQVESTTDWHGLDGWTSMLCVEVGDAG